MSNPYVPDEIQKRWKQYEFLGKPMKRANGKSYVRARRKHWPWQGHTHVYSMDDDFFWHDVSLAEVP